MKHLRAVITERRDITGDLWIVRLRPESPIAFAPGQYVTVGLETATRIVERPYSVASSPHETELEFFIEVVPGGELTPQLYNVQVGGEVYVRPSAKGHFAFDTAKPNHFMAATVTGVAPFVSMIRSLAMQPEPIPYRIAVLHSASIAPELAYSDELADRSERYPWLTYIPTVSRIWLDAEWRGERGRVEDVARKHLDALGFHPASTTAYLCGHPDMVCIMRSILKRAGFEKGSIRTELYWPGDRQRSGAPE